MATLRERCAELERACAEEGSAALATKHDEQSWGQSWRCDPIPFLLPEAEFAGLAAGLSERADLLETILADLYGPSRLLAEGHLPPALVYPSHAYLRPLRATVPDMRPPPRHLHLYAADLARGPDGRWCVLAGHTGEPAGLAYALENRRLMASVLPEAFGGVEVSQLRPFLDTWQDSLQRQAPEGAGNPGLVLLSPGHHDRRWFEHVVLARALGCALVEDGDLTVRGGKVWVKTLRGLQPVHVMLRRQRGAAIDPLEFSADTSRGTAGLMAAWRDGAVQILNGPGAGYAEAPALSAYLPSLARVLMGRDLTLPSVPALWLGDPDRRAAVEADMSPWLIMSATDASAPAETPATLSPAALASLRARVAERPWAFAAQARLPPSLVPCIGDGGRLDPRPMVLRLFLAWDGASWRPLPGGLARMPGQSDTPAGSCSTIALCKDVWVMREEGIDISGPAQLLAPVLAITRTPGDVPSRVADNFYWLGRYLERLETACRLMRVMLARLSRDTLLPRDLPDMAVLTACLVDAGVLDEEVAGGASPAQLADLMMRALAGETGAVARLTGRVRNLADKLRDRLSSEMHTTIAHELGRLKGARASLRPVQRKLGIGPMHDFAGEVLRFCGTVAGYAAESMALSGGRLFLDLGRRIERAQSVASQLAHALDQPPDRIEAGLSLALELCDSALTYRSRYLTTVQPAPVIDLLVADNGNPRGLGSQLIGARDMLAVLAEREEADLAAPLDTCILDAEAIVAELLGAADQAVLASRLAPRLRGIGEQVAGVSDAVVRRYFAVLPATFTGGLSG